VAGDHQLELELERTRFETTAAPDDVSRYAAVADVSLTV
jgi:hypothetical protein